MDETVVISRNSQRDTTPGLKREFIANRYKMVSSS